MPEVAERGKPVGVLSHDGTSGKKTEPKGHDGVRQMKRQEEGKTAKTDEILNNPPVRWIKENSTKKKEVWGGKRLSNRKRGSEGKKSEASRKVGTPPTVIKREEKTRGQEVLKRKKKAPKMGSKRDHRAVPARRIKKTRCWESVKSPRRKMNSRGLKRRTKTKKSGGRKIQNSAQRQALKTGGKNRGQNGGRVKKDKGRTKRLGSRKVHVRAPREKRWGEKKKPKKRRNQ